ncbi:MAG: aminotransferase class IV [Steroidobacteraceae bacterium]
MPAHLEINGAPASAEQLLAATTNYGHFTSLQVRNGCVAGLDLHLRRLDDATRTLFGQPLDTVQLLDWLRDAVRRAGDRMIAAASVRMLVFPAHFNREQLAGQQPVAVLISVAAAREHPQRAIRAQTRDYQRDLPDVKHVATFGLFWQRRLAQQAGYDDALFVDARGGISEGSTWNIGFWDGERILWPRAALLDGVTQQLLKKALVSVGVPSETRRIQRQDLVTLRGAFACNSTGIQPIAAIDAREFGAQPELLERLGRAYRGVIPDKLL